MINPVLERTRERFYRVLLDYGMRLTKPRRAMLDYLFDRPQWKFKAEELYQQLNKEAPGIVSRATVYRTLDVLEDARVIEKRQAAENGWEYELSEAGLRSCHYHLIDIETGRTVGFTVSHELRALLRKICAANGFKEQYHVLEVYGEFKRARKPRAQSRQTPAGEPEVQRSAEGAE